MTNQEFFDKTCKHFAQQKQRCVNEEGSCKLRIETGNKKKVLKCVVGKYVKKSEFIEPKNIDTFNDICKLVANKYEINYKLLRDMQWVHDISKELDTLKERLIEVARIYNLDTKCIELITEWKK